MTARSLNRIRTQSILGSAAVLLQILIGIPSQAELNRNSNTLIQATSPSDDADFGSALTTGDFNCDGLEDLAIGSPGVSVDGSLGAGVVQVLLSSTPLLAPLNAALPFYSNLTIEQNIGSTPEIGDNFGSILAAGDLNDDGCSDLVVGVPSEDLGAGIGGLDNGAISILYGHSETPFGTGNFITQNTPGVDSDAAQQSDFFGSSLTIGNFNGDQYDDLAVGVRGEDLTGAPEAGAVHVFLGNAGGLDLSSDIFLTEGSNGYQGSPEPQDIYGAALASGDFDQDGYDDLAIGVSGQEVIGEAEAGDVHVIYGTALGLSPLFEERFSQLGLIIGLPEAGDHFGSSLTAGDFDGDGYLDLGIGVPGELVSVTAGVTLGQVNVIYGNQVGLNPSRNAIFNASQLDFADLGGDFVGGDVFYPTPIGNVLAAGDIDGDGFDELLLGMPNRDFSQLNGPTSCAAGAAESRTDTGSVLVLHGTSDGISLENNEGFFNWSDDGLDNGCLQPFEQLGQALVVFDHNQDGQGDLTVGIPGAVAEGGRGIGNSFGEVAIVTSGIFASGFEPDPVAFAIDQDDDWDQPSVP